MNRISLLALSLVLASASVSFSASEKRELNKNPRIEMQEIDQNSREYFYYFEAEIGMKKMYLWGKLKNVAGLKDFAVKTESVYVEKENSVQWNEVEPRIIELIKEAYQVIC